MVTKRLWILLTALLLALGSFVPVAHVSAQDAEDVEEDIIELVEEVDELEVDIDMHGDAYDFSDVEDLLDEALLRIQDAEDALDSDELEDAEGYLEQAEDLIDQAENLFDDITGDSDDDDMNGDEIEGVVQWVDTSALVVEFTDGATVHLSSGSDIDMEGDFTTLGEVDDALWFGTTVYAEAAGEWDVSTFAATSIKFETDSDDFDDDDDDSDDDDDDDSDDDNADNRKRASDLASCDIWPNDTTIVNRFQERLTLWFADNPERAQQWLPRLEAVLTSVPDGSRIWCVLKPLYDHLVELVLNLDTEHEGRSLLSELRAELGQGN